MWNNRIAETHLYWYVGGISAICLGIVLAAILLNPKINSAFRRVWRVDLLAVGAVAAGLCLFYASAILLVGLVLFPAVGSHG